MARVGIIIATLFLILSFKPAPNAITEGFISYSIDVETDQAAAALLTVGSSLEVAFKGNYMKAVARVAGGSNTVSVVADHKNQTGITLMDILGEKKGVKLTKDRFEKAKTDMDKLGENPMRVTDETKTIAGYTCKKVLMKHKESGANVILYLTDEINPKNDPFAQLLISEVKGFPLGIVIRKDETTVKIMADKVTNRAPSDSAFSMSIPSDYTLTTFEELEKTAKSKMEKSK